jgi:CspA family cold shock protein
MSDFKQSKTHTGGEGTGDEWDWLGPSLGVCTRKPSVKPKPSDMTGKSTGTVTQWNDERGFGFIKPDKGGLDVFVHAADLKRAGIDRLLYGERLAFDIIAGKLGKPQATNIAEVV